MLVTKLKNNLKSGLFLAAMGILLLSAITLLLYPLFDQVIEKKYVAPWKTHSFLTDLYHDNYVLYHKLMEKKTLKNIRPSELFQQKMKGEDPAVSSNDSQQEEDDNEIESRRKLLDSRLDTWESTFFDGSNKVDYYAYNKENQQEITNTQVPLEKVWKGDRQTIKELQSIYHYYFVIDFDSTGGFNITDYGGIEENSLTKVFMEEENSLQNEFSPVKSSVNEYGYEEISEPVYKLTGPKNITIVYGISISAYKTAEGKAEIFGASFASLMQSDLSYYFYFIIAGAAILSFVIYRSRKGRSFLGRIHDLPAEASLLGLIILYGAILQKVFEMTIKTLDGYLANNLTMYLSDYGIPNFISQLLVCLGNFMIWGLFIGSVFILTYPVLEGVLLGPKAFLKNKVWTFHLVKFLRLKIKEWYRRIFILDIQDDLQRKLKKFMIANFIILCVFSSIWFIGIFFLIPYCLVLHITIRKYICNIKEKYALLLNSAGSIADGKLDAPMLDAGVFQSLQEQIQRIQTGFRKAVEKEVISQNMKNELITNVSHDLKTPLTAIITYVDLLKSETLTEEQRMSYVATLDKKSQRLKTLIEDLFEISKANSRNVQLSIIKVDIVALMKQTRYELSDKLDKSTLEFRWNLPDHKVILLLDSQKTFRIFENLIINIVNYSMPGTRVYIDIIVADTDILISLKNMSAQELNFDTADITERFVRGDQSRNTDGSGLGLAIAKSFVELQQGTFHVVTDGDLFKIVITFPYVKDLAEN